MTIFFLLSVPFSPCSDFTCSGSSVGIIFLLPTLIFPHWHLKVKRRWEGENKTSLTHYVILWSANDLSKEKWIKNTFKIFCRVAWLACTLKDSYYISSRYYCSKSRLGWACTANVVSSSVPTLVGKSAFYKCINCSKAAISRAWRNERLLPLGGPMSPPAGESEWSVSTSQSMCDGDVTQGWHRFRQAKDLDSGSSWICNTTGWPSLSVCGLSMVFLVSSSGRAESSISAASLLRDSSSGVPVSSVVSMPGVGSVSIGQNHGGV